MSRDPISAWLTRHVRDMYQQLRDRCRLIAHITARCRPSTPT